MPISDWHGLSETVNEIVRLAPTSVLDLGCGFGLYGALCRNYLDALHGRCHDHQWQTRIWGVEAFEGYRNPMWDVYNGVDAADFTGDRLTWKNAGWDLVLMIDSLEHLTPDVGAKFLNDLVERNRHVIVSVPNGRMDQGPAHGNEYETHRATYTGLEFDHFPGATEIHRSVCFVVSIPGKLK